jgi:tetratricopeptide (TPR) repeat protein
MEILIDAEAKFPRGAAIPYNLACYYCQLGEMEKAKRYLKEAFEIDLNWRKAALDDEDLRPFWDSLQTTVDWRDDGKNLLDYVIRRFTLSSARLNKPGGLNFR